MQRILKAGVNLVRINTSHSNAEEHAKRIQLVREVSSELGKEIGLLLDLQGPKIRIAKFKAGEVDLTVGQSFVLDASLDENAGDDTQVGIDYKALPRDVAPGDNLLLDDGRIIFEVVSTQETRIECVVTVGGILSNNKGINKQGGGLSAKALTEKDKKYIQFAADAGVDYVAVSFPRHAEDIEEAKALLQAAGSPAGIVAKIERREAIEEADLDAIIQASDAVMVARGDLGVEIGFAELPGVQKHIIDRARLLDKAVITATQMMESMIENAIPTRAEVSDVANAVLDGTDAVMLSAETATGQYPVKVVEAMAQICLAAEKQRIRVARNPRLDGEFKRIDEAIAMATMFTANHMEVKAIVALTETGSTPLWMSRIRSGIPIYGVSRHQNTRGKMTLYRGVYPIDFDITKYERWEVIKAVLNEMIRQNIVNEGDLVVVTRGDVAGVGGRANALKIVTVEKTP